MKHDLYFLHVRSSICASYERGESVSSFLLKKGAFSRKSQKAKENLKHKEPLGKLTLSEAPRGG